MPLGTKRVGAGAAAILAMMGALAVPAAAQQVTPGEWRYATTVAMPNAAMPRIPPEELAKLPPQMRARVEGMMHGHTMHYSACLTSARPMPRMPKKLHCRIDHENRAGATIAWSASCTMPDGRVSHADAIAIYHRDRMAMDMTIHVAGPDGKSMTMHQHTTGRYVGPCKPR